MALRLLSRQGMALRRFAVVGAVLLASGLTWLGVFRIASTVRSVAHELDRAGAVQITPRP